MKKLVLYFVLVGAIGFAEANSISKGDINAHEDPEIIDISPKFAEQGEELAVKIIGNNTDFNIIQGSQTVNNVEKVYFKHDDLIIEGDNVSISSKTLLSAEFDIEMDAPVGLYDVAVVQKNKGDTVTLARGFVIIEFDKPAIVSVVPDSAEQGEELTVSITGHNTEFSIGQGSQTVNNVDKVYLKRDNSIIEGDNVSISSKTSLSAVFTIEMDAPAGLYDVAVVQKARGDTATLFKGFTISDTINDPPEFTSSPITEAEEDSLYTYNITAEDPDAEDILTIGLIVLPSWLSLKDNGDGNAILSGIPINEHVGDTNVVLTLNDGVNDTVVQEFSIVVENTNDTPVVNNEIDDQTACENEEFSFTFPDHTFVDIDVGDELTYSAELDDGFDLPQWLDFDALERNFSGIPEKSDIGTISIKVTAEDGSGETVSDIFDLEVEPIGEILSDGKLIKYNGIITKPFIVSPNPVCRNQDFVYFGFATDKRYDANLKIYDATGNVVHTSAHRIEPDRTDGKQFVFWAWNLRNNRGVKVASGTYLAILKINGSDGSIEIFKITIGIKSK